MDCCCRASMLLYLTVITYRHDRRRGHRHHLSQIIASLPHEALVIVPRMCCHCCTRSTRLFHKILSRESVISKNNSTLGRARTLFPYPKHTQRIQHEQKNVQTALRWAKSIDWPAKKYVIECQPKMRDASDTGHERKHQHSSMLSRLER